MVSIRVRMLASSDAALRVTASGHGGDRSEAAHDRPDDSSLWGTPVSRNDDLD